mmetsp:Transcript_22434/g.46516  ORF Transcript_22434/g.46516 Transcript_22434/m.46516 type:complete len:452 (+) Transcript_22434:34-1389(+)
MFGADFVFGHAWDFAVPDQVVTSDQSDPIRLEGDFYREANDTIRSACLTPEPELVVSSCLGHGFDEAATFQGVPSSISGLLGHAPSWYGFKAHEDASCTPEEQDLLTPRVGRFTEADLAPPITTDPCYGFSACTLRVLSSSPANLGNHIVDFLETQVTSSITKLNPTKFTIKADVFIDGAACTLKIRLSSTGCGTVVAEFLRRKGSCLCFGAAYRQAGDYLRRLLVVTSGPEVSDECRPPWRSQKVDAAEIAPLLDMAGSADLPGLQAESAAALVEQVQDDEVAGSLCTSLAFEHFKSLLKADETDVAHPTAQMLSHLSLRAEAMPRFADEELLSIITTKVQSEVTSSLVQQELAQVLSNTLSGHAAALSARVTKDVTRTLALARRKRMTLCSSTHGNSVQAHSQLKGIRPSDLSSAPDKSAIVQHGGAGPPRAGPSRITTPAASRRQLPA